MSYRSKSTNTNKNFVSTKPSGYNSLMGNKPTKTNSTAPPQNKSPYTTTNGAYGSALETTTSKVQTTTNTTAYNHAANYGYSNNNTNSPSKSPYGPNLTSNPIQGSNNNGYSYPATNNDNRSSTNSYSNNNPSTVYQGRQAIISGGYPINNTSSPSKHHPSSTNVVGNRSTYDTQQAMQYPSVGNRSGYDSQQAIQYPNVVGNRNTYETPQTTQYSNSTANDVKANYGTIGTNNSNNNNDSSSLSRYPYDSTSYNNNNSNNNNYKSPYAHNLVSNLTNPSTAYSTEFNYGGNGVVGGGGGDIAQMDNNYNYNYNNNNNPSKGSTGTEVPVVVVLGRTGAGKSTLINKIAGYEVVKEGHTLLSETSDSSKITLSMNNEKYDFIDTPGFADNRPDQSNTVIIKNILATLKVVEERGFKICLFCVAGVRPNFDFTDQEEFNLLATILGSGVYQHVLLVITQTNILNQEAKDKVYSFYNNLFVSNTFKNKPYRVLFADFDNFDSFKKDLEKYIKRKSNYQLKVSASNGRGAVSDPNTINPKEIYRVYANRTSNKIQDLQVALEKFKQEQNTFDPTVQKLIKKKQDVIEQLEIKMAGWLELAN